uniref:Uncharacterized protein n=1 Tax=Fagus sylvatica TaxID=28930 RepID=A0A2N9F203_FAGSY
MADRCSCSSPHRAAQRLAKLRRASSLRPSSEIRARARGSLGPTAIQSRDLNTIPASSSQPEHRSHRRAVAPIPAPICCSNGKPPILRSVRDRDLVWSLRGGLRDEAVERRGGTLDLISHWGFADLGFAMGFATRRFVGLNNGLMRGLLGLWFFCCAMVCCDGGFVGLL